MNTLCSIPTMNVLAQMRLGNVIIIKKLYYIKETYHKMFICCILWFSLTDSSFDAFFVCKQPQSSFSPQHNAHWLGVSFIRMCMSLFSHSMHT